MTQKAKEQEKPVVKKPAQSKTKKVPKKKVINRKGGRKSLFEEKKDRILQYIREGNYQTTAANMVGICMDTLIEWKKTKPGFSEAVKEAESEAEAEMVNMVRQHSAGNWQAGAWYLERKFPERWGKIDRLQIDKYEKEVAELSDDELIAELHRSGRQGMEAPE